VSVLESLTGCDWCPDARPNGLYLRGDDGSLRCVACWKAAGRPFPIRPPSVAELHEAEVATRERMMARGGSDAHIVRKGLS
jgi:hypothetical protein